MTHELPDDLAALDAARALCQEHTIEVYEADRLVARVKQGDEPPAMSDPPSRLAGIEKPQGPRRGPS
jgi:hypothetical protein